MDFNADVDWEEQLMYQPGLTVEFKAKPGTYDTIARYETMMVPPIWLENDPQPRYPHELRILSLVALPGLPVAPVQLALSTGHKSA